MNDANVYAPPQTDIRQSGDAQGNDPALRALSTKELKKLFNHSHTIRALIFLWCLGLVLMMAAIIPLMLAGGGRGSDGGLMVMLFLVIGALQGAAVYGCWNRLPWGRTVGMVVCVLSLASIPIGTIIGILGLLAFSGGKRLFGPDRLTHQQLKAEVAYRKANNIR